MKSDLGTWSVCAVTKEAHVVTLVGPVGAAVSDSTGNPFFPNTPSNKRSFMLPKLLIIEDSPSMLHMYKGFLQQEPLEVLAAETGAEGLRILRKERPALLLLDLKLPDIDGQEILEAIAAEGIETAAVVMTAHGSVNVAVEAMRLGAVDFLVKPFTQERLSKTLTNVQELHQLKTEVAAYRELDRPSYDEMIGSSLPMQAVYRTIDSASPTDATVFIVGETGTGKELVAQALHRGSARAGGQLVVLNCAAIPKDLIESELFGHVKGAFTGATGDRDGAAHLAAEGTLFLDEIGEMDISLQSKLLRFLQSGTFQRVGSRAPKARTRAFCVRPTATPGQRFKRGPSAKISTTG